MQGSTINESQNILGYEQEATASGHEHQEHPDLRMLGVVVFLVAESMIFLGLFSAYLIYRAMSPVWPPEGTERELLLPVVNTVILISSSFVINQGTIAIKKNDPVALRNWFIATAIMGLTFLTGQAYEYSQLAFGLTTNLYASCFYVLTGFHGLHVTFGVVLILGVLWRGRQASYYSKESHFGPEATELYWHFVDVVWIILFILLYLL
jgi:cytochrome c oxidase subunit 3